ncbi:MAG: methionyl-tRNA formyltransferase [Alphaproteobacteria bacterium]|nr:methionyl-tRNA formyltransferase [Alphaproteobacteria bacterium]
MKLVFMGTPDFSVPILTALAKEHDVVGVFTQPARPTGRGHKLTPSPVEVEARRLSIPVFTPLSLRKDENARAQMKALNAEVAVVCAYGLILPSSVLNMFPKGAINIHASLLPRWRGAAPIERALMAGDEKTGITIMRMDAGLDTGDMLKIGEVEITPRMKIDELKAKMNTLSIQLILDVLKNMPTPQKQPEEGACYAEKLSKQDFLIDFNQSAFVLDRYICALNGLSFFYKNDKITLLEATPLSLETEEKPGTVLDENLTLSCGEKTALKVHKIKRSGKKEMPVQDFLRGYALEKGTFLGQ